MDQPIRPRPNRHTLPSVRVPVPGSPRDTYEVRMPCAVATQSGEGWEIGYLERVTVAHRNQLEGAMRSAWIIDAQRRRKVFL